MSTVTVLGIDPGSRATGWGIVCEQSGVLRLVDCGVVRSEASTKARTGAGIVAGAGAEMSASFSERLARIFRELAVVVARYAPDEAAVEQVFTAKNPASALKLGQARGVAVAACAAHGLSVADYEPRLIKKTLVGTGGAEKQQVSFMVGRLLNTKVNWSADAGDALAVAICHLTLRRFARLVG